MKRTFLLVGLIIVTYTTIGCTQVYAQSIDYGSLQDLFGEPVTTSATGTPQRASEVATNMTIITADEIRQSGMRNIAEIIAARVPGMDALQTSSTDFDLGVRGDQRVFQPSLLVLIDGRQVFADGLSVTPWYNLPVNIDDIRQIEVVKGPASALFGSNAGDGVINIITYSPIYDDDNVATLRYGTQQTVSGDATVTSKFATPGGLKMSVGGMGADEFDTTRTAADQAVTRDPYQRYVAASSVFEAQPGLLFNSEATYSTSQATVGNFNSALAGEDLATYSLKGGLDWDSSLGLIKSNNYLNHTEPTVLASGVATPVKTFIDLYVSQLEDDFTAGPDNVFRIGIEYRHKNLNVDVPSVASNQQHPLLDENAYSASASWLWQITKDLSFTNAARFDDIASQFDGRLGPVDTASAANLSHTTNAFTANSGLVYKLDDNDSLRATYGRGVLLPSLFQVDQTSNLHLIGSPTVVDFEGNPELKPTIVTNYEVGYDRKIDPIYSTARISTFFEISQDVAAFNPNTIVRVINGVPFALNTSLNVGDSRSYGTELELLGNHGGFRWDASYSFVRAVDNQGVSNAVGYDGATPEHHVRLLGGYTTGSWEFDTEGQVQTSTDMYRRDPTFEKMSIDGYFSLSARVGYNITDNLTLALSGTDLTQDVSEINPYPVIERQVFLSVTDKF